MIANLVRNGHLESVTTKVIDFAHESYSQALIDEMMPLWKEHYEEIALYQDIPLSPVLAIYETSDKSGMLRIYTARCEGKLIGYQIFFVHSHSHYSTAKVANQDILFLIPEMRKGFIGYNFLKWCDEQLAHDGVDIVYQHVENTKDFSFLLKKLGYNDHEMTYSRRLR